jgi:hypothetical protein
MKNLLLASSLLLLTPYAHSALSLESFEKIGFVKNKQPYFQMFGAKDGWHGQYKEKQVWIYFFEDKSKIPLEQIKGILAKTNNTRLVCAVQNVIILEDSEFLCKDAKSKL